MWGVWMMNIQMHVGFLLSFWMLLRHLLTHILQQDAVSEELLSTVARLIPYVACRRPGDASGGRNNWRRPQLGPMGA